MILGLLPGAALAVNNAIDFSIPMQKNIKVQPGATAVEAAYSFELDGLDEVGGSITANTASVTTNKTAA